MSEPGDWEKYIAPWKDVPPPPDGFAEKIKAEIEAKIEASIKENKPWPGFDEWQSTIKSSNEGLTADKIKGAMEILSKGEVGLLQGFTFVEESKLPKPKISNANIWWGKIGG